MEGTLVRDRTVKGRATIRVALYLETAEPIRPTIVQMPVDPYLVNLHLSSSLRKRQILDLELPDVEIEFTGGRIERNHMTM